MTIADITKQITNEFNDFMSRIQVIENNLNKMQSRLESKIEKAEAQIEFQVKESNRVESQSRELDKRLESAGDYLKESKAKADEALDVLESCKRKEESIISRQKQLSIQESSAKESMQDANKRLAWAEMEERRLKFLQKKIDLVTQDESIKKKLKELE